MPVSVSTDEGDIVRRLAGRLNGIALSVASRSELAAALYFTGRGAFGSEARRLAVGLRLHRLQGRRSDELDAVAFALRRDVHRLEKGLSMPQRRPVFAAQFVGDAVDRTEALTGHDAYTADVLWAREVLAQYFDTVDATDRLVAAAHARFGRTPAAAGSDPVFPLADRFGTHLSPDDLRAAFAELVQRRRSVRTFLPEVPDLSILEELVAAAHQSPSACNRVAYRFHVITDDATKRELTALAPGAAGWAADAPVVLAVTGLFRAYREWRDRKAVYIDSCMATMTLEYAAVARRLATCTINWPQVAANERAAQRLLGLADDEKVICLVAMGYPAIDALVPRSDKPGVDRTMVVHRSGDSARW